MKAHRTILKSLLATYIILCFPFSFTTNAQVKIGNNVTTVDANSILEIETTDKGFLPPRVALNNSDSAAPLTAPVTAGMLVYSTGGALTNGYYYWNGTKWVKIVTNDVSSGAVTETSNSTLLKTETFVLASNDITLTLPAITSSDNGLQITIKNNGSYKDLVTIQGSGGATIDSLSNAKLTRWKSRSFVAYGGNWHGSEKECSDDYLFDVTARGSWTTLTQMMEFLDEHMTGPSVVRLGEEAFPVSNTITIDLPYPLTIQGLSYGV